MMITLAAFIAGSVIGARHVPWWERLPAIRPISLIAAFGLARALLMSMVLFGLVAVSTRWLERHRARPTKSLALHRDSRVARLVRGPWPLAAGALGLAAINIATLALAGRPWGVTSAFALWGSKALAATGINVAAWEYWSAPARSVELGASVFRDVTSVMDFGILLGALSAASLAGRVAPAWRIPARSVAASITGGLMLGYGARIAHGCNIVAYFSGVASASLHGWVWFIAAFGGNVLGTRLSPLFCLNR